MDWKLELVVVPVSDVDCAKTFYTENAGFDLDVDHRAGEDFRVVQLTPPGSACSIAIGTGIGQAAPGSAQGLHLVVSDIDAARAELVPDERYAMSRAEGPFPMETVYSWEDIGGGGTRMTLQSSGHPRGLSLLLAPLLRSSMKHSGRKDLARLKTILEAV